MFTGLVHSAGQVVDLSPRPLGGLRLTVQSPLFTAARAGDSIAHNGCCLTVTDPVGDRASFDLLAETLRLTNLGDLKVGDQLVALVGPMGIPSHIGKARKVLCVGGGLGVAPVFPQARAWKESGAYVIGVLGFRNKDLVFWDDKFAACCDELIVCTDDGSAGIKGLVTEGIRQAVEKHADIDECVAIGPPVMMKGCAEATRPHKIRTIVSLNPVMVDGTGMCGGCRVKIGDRVKFACVDGPDFDGHLVDFDDLMFRLQRYKATEREASDRFNESCRLRSQADAAN
jgi:NAD(P)H-flavin reductase